MHVDRYRSVYGVVLQPGRSRPDLFGPRDAGTLSDWLVIEAKGRTNEIRASDIQAMVSQKARVVTVGGNDPWLRGGAATHFSDGYLAADLVDPAPDANDQRVEAFADYVADPSLFARAYYEPVLAVLNARPRLSLDDPRGVPLQQIQEVDVAIGLADPSIALRRPPPVSTEPLRRPLFHVGADGVVISLGPSWSPENMRLDPSEREQGLLE